MMAVVVDFLKEYNIEFESILQEVVNKDLLFEASSFSSKLKDAIAYSCLNGGKRIRPILTLLAAEAIKQSKDHIPLEENPALGAALAIELVHCGSLVHDDLPCMDDDELRRGQPTTHIEFDEPTALLAGDYLMVYPYQVLIKYSSRITANYGLIIEATKNLGQAIQKMIIGQSLDLELANTKADVTLKADQDPDSIMQIESSKVMQKYKTGALLELAVTNGALMANASFRQIKALKHYAANLGLAFQIVDDILDVTSDAETLGKATQKDEEQNKFTYVKYYGLERAQTIADNLIKEAKLALEDINIYNEKLNLIGDYIVSRKR
jgi:geranylgeranyl pyrophosphate synthase